MKSLFFHAYLNLSPTQILYYSQLTDDRNWKCCKEKILSLHPLGSFERKYLFFQEATYVRVQFNSSLLSLQSLSPSKLILKFIAKRFLSNFCSLSYRKSIPEGHKARLNTQIGHQNSWFLFRNAFHRWSHCSRRHHLKNYLRFSKFFVKQKYFTTKPILFDANVSVRTHDMTWNGVCFALSFHFFDHIVCQLAIFFVFCFRSTINLTI